MDVAQSVDQAEVSGVGFPRPLTQLCSDSFPCVVDGFVYVSPKGDTEDFHMRMVRDSKGCVQSRP